MNIYPFHLRRRSPRFCPANCLVLALASFLMPASGRVQAQAEYRFQVENLALQVILQPDASARLHYQISFRNQPGAHPIDIVDIGLPHGGYRLSSMTATIGGRPVQSIRPSSYIDIGVELDLGSEAIKAGERGVVEFQCVMPGMVYADTTDAQLASVQIRPTWFDPGLQVGTTQLDVAIHVPPGVAAAELRFQDERQRYYQLVDNFSDGGPAHAVALWKSPQHQLSELNPKFGLSFPRRVMQRVIDKTAIQLLVEWFASRPELQLASGLTLLGLLAFAFFRFSHGTGFVVYFVLAAMLGFAFLGSPGLHLLTWPGMLALVGLNEWFLQRRRPRSKYLPAMATVEGGGIKRGLTAPQAAVLLEAPLPKVLSMVIFGLLKKQVLELIADHPLTAKVRAEFTTTRELRLQAASQRGIVLHDYEHPFLDRLMQHSGPVETCDLNLPLGELIRSVVERMQGFDFEVSREYYQRIVQRAWKECESVGEIKQRDEVVERNFEWMMMDPKWTDILQDWHRRGYDYRPRWTRIPQQGTSLPGSSSSGGGSTAPAKGSGAAPTLSEVAGSFAGWAETAAGRFASALEPAAMGLDVPSGKGVIDLSGVDRVTGDIFQALAKAAAENSRQGGGRGGGGGGGCACACAGCACACACAGGGR